MVFTNTFTNFRLVIRDSCLKPYFSAIISILPRSFLTRVIIIALLLRTHRNIDAVRRFTQPPIALRVHPVIKSGKIFYKTLRF